jgi:secondary thiamine-phosphate synthase enzyme
MIWIQKELTLKPRPRGFHLITGELESALPELADLEVGLVHIHLKHTSASLSLNENADPDVRRDLESIFNHLVPERAPYYVHTMEGPDDMPAHGKSAILGASLTLPVTKGRFNLGTWQGIYLCEHRNRGGARRIVITLQGNSA